MKKKKRTFEHSQKEICGLCQKDVITTKDNWTAITDFNKSSQSLTKFYHTNCLNDLIREKTNIIANKYKEQLSKFAGDMLKKITDNKSTEFLIK